MSIKDLPVSPRSDAIRIIPLTAGKIALVSDADYDRLSVFKWRASSIKNGVYAVTGKYETKLHMHRLVVCPSPADEIDHIRHHPDIADNTRQNLRIANRNQNCANARRRSRSGYRGVKQNGRKWSTYITVNNKARYIGNYTTIEEAATAYNDAALEAFGMHATLNIIGTGGTDEH